MSKEVKVQIGDRFIWSMPYMSDNDIWEVISIDNDFPLGKCITEAFGWKKGQTHKWEFSDTSCWLFVGNFAKSHSFLNLYDRLNAESERS